MPKGARRRLRHVELPPVRVHVHVPKVYADNFKYGRVENWTH